MVSVSDGASGDGVAPGIHFWISGHGIGGRLGPGRTVGAVVRGVVVVLVVDSGACGDGVVVGMTGDVCANVYVGDDGVATGYSFGGNVEPPASDDADRVVVVGSAVTIG